MPRRVSWNDSGAFESEGRETQQAVNASKRSRGSSFRELLSASNLSSAIGRIYRETQRLDSQNDGQVSEEVQSSREFIPLLTRQLSVKLNKLEIIPKTHERASVIAHTPSRNPQTSTPSNSPPPPPLPPRSCQSLGPILPPRPRSHSPSCSELSSIHGDPFSEDESYLDEISVIGRPTARNQTAQIPAFRIPKIIITKTMELFEKEIKIKHAQIKYRMRSFPPEELAEGHLATIDVKLESFEELVEQFVLKIEELCLDYKQELGQSKEKYWTDLLVTAEAEAKAYKRSMVKRVTEIRNSNSSNVTQDDSRALDSTDLKRQELQIAERSLAAQEKDRLDRHSSELREKAAKRTISATKITKKVDAIFEEIEKLNDKLSAVGDPQQVTDIVLGRATRETIIWKEDMEKIVEKKRSVEELAANDELTEEESRVDEVSIRVDKLVCEVTEAIESVKLEDDARELYTLDTAKTETMKLPFFEGHDDEDFAKFRELVEKAFVQNRTSKADKLAKLREVLRGHAKKLVPLSLTNSIDDAWEALTKAYGDPARLMQNRKDSLLKLGPLPKENGKGGRRSQIEWFLELEAILRNIIDLGNKTNAMYGEAFSATTFRTIQKMFPPNLMRKLMKCSGEFGPHLMEQFLTIISELRSEAQNFLLIEETPTPSHIGSKGDLSHFTDPDDNSGGGFGRGKGGGSKSRGNSSYTGGRGCFRSGGIDGSEPNLVAYKPPRRDEECRICNTLETRGDTTNLYDNHLHNYATGCPRYIELSVKERLRICREAQMCLKCHDPKVIFKPSDKNHDCPIKPGKKNKRYSCTRDNCTNHLWICNWHKEENEEKLLEFKKDFSKNFNLEFGLTVMNIPAQDNSPKVVLFDKNPATKHVQADAKAGAKSKVRKKAKRVSKVEVKLKVKKAIPGLLRPEKTSSPVVATSSTENNFVPTNEATAYKKLKKKLSATGSNEELRPISKGRPQFMIGATKGKSRPLLTLYDTGCGSVLFREGVPQNELSPSVLRNKGPYIVGGVGDTAVKVNDEWMCSTSIVDGTRQVWQGWTVDKITSTMPFVDLTKAEAELKADCKDNTELQEMKCEPVVGGDIDILLGILYQSIFPIPVHTLESGLTIYKLQITSHDKRYNSVIGGPHDSFQYMANYFGGLNIVFANLCQQLDTFRRNGPPKLSQVMMTKEDQQFAEQYKEWEIEEFSDVFEEIDEDPVEEPKPLFDENKSNVLNEAPAVADATAAPTQATAPMDNSALCTVCGDELSENVMNALLAALPAKTLDDEDDSHTWRRLAQQEGLNIEYRCPKCRSCSDCRRSFATERVSMREEAEEQQIWDSVTLDWENKRIICYLPLRGSEEEFLSNNREIALKILDQQCYKYFRDEETKPVIVKAFDKLFKNEQLVLWKDLSEEEKKVIESKTVSHYIPWRVVFKPSISTPARPVFDGSANTKPRPDGSAGRCLNDAVVKGRVVTLNLIRMMLRFMVGKVAVQGDLKQFYASIKLVQDQWNLQRVLFRENLDPDGELLECVVKTLIWGIKCVSAQSECSIIKLAEAIREEFPLLADFLLNCRFVDDIGGSAMDLETLKQLTAEADKFFAMLGLACKGWSYSGSHPPPDVSEEDQTIKIAGMVWFTMLDLLEIPLPQLHFSTKRRGRLVIGTEVFEGSMVEDMEKFVPKLLTRRMIVSKNSSIFDLPGKLVPILTGFKLDLREAVVQTSGWDDAVSAELRSKWVKNFWRIEGLRGIKFNRARMPTNAVSTQMDLITAADAANPAKIVGSWGRFRLDNGKFSCQQVLGRSLLGNEGTIPKEELEALMMGSNLSWIIRQALEEWISSHIVISDSRIALCWVSSEKKRLSLFHRNRCAQIRRGTDLDCLFHCITEENPADLGTRPELVLDSDVGPQSKWEKGLPWMTGEIDDAVAKGILTPVANLRLNEEDEELYKQGIVFEKTKEILTRGHPAVLLTSRQENIKSRFESSNYLISPSKFKFEKTVRILATVMRFLKSFKCLKKRFESSKKKAKFQMFISTPGIKFQMHIMTPVFCVMISQEIKVYDLFGKNYMENVFDDPKERAIDSHRIAAVSFGCKKPGLQFKGKYHIVLTDDDLSRSLEYLYKKGTEEVKTFNKPEFLKKIAIESEGILYSRSRILDSQRFQIAGGLEEFDVLGTKEYGLKMKTPLLDRFSPLSYSIGEYIHRCLSKHKGYENNLRESLNHVFIIHGLSLFREIGEDCVKCVMMRKKYLDVSMGPVGDEQLMIAPAFWVTMCDIFGPCNVYVPGHSMSTRGRQPIDVKCYVLVFVCPTTKLVNLQVIEGKSADAVVDGVNRLGCEVGIPSFVLVDQDSGILKVLKEAEVNVRDLQLVLHKEKGIRFRTCPVSGHNFHGAVERKIRSVQECLEKSEIEKQRLHATGLQTALKLIENDMNNLPLGYTYGRDSDNSPLLKLIFPNMLRVGRLNCRALEGPVRMPSGPGELMKRVEQSYSSFFRIWNSTMVPKLMKAYKWFKTGEGLRVDDLVWFQKDESELSSKWSLGIIASVEKGKDGLVRRASVKYQNSSENAPRETDRAARSLIKLFNIDDQSWMDEMAEVEKLVFDLQSDEANDNKEASESVEVRDSAENDVHRDYVMNHVSDLRFKLTAKVEWSSSLKPCRKCCCYSHCLFAKHGTIKGSKERLMIQACPQFNFAGMLDKSWLAVYEYEEEILDVATAQDQFMQLLCSVNVNFDEMDL